MLRVDSRCFGTDPGEGEVAACSHRVIKRIVEGRTDIELEEMVVVRAAAEDKVALHTGLIPLA